MIALLEARNAGLFRRGHFANNLLAGLVVGVVALPLAMAFAIASGVRPEQGIYTAIVAGLCTSLFGGTRLQISGPTGAFIAVLSVITAQHGIIGLQVATMMAGIILLLLGMARLGSVIRFIPEPVIAGFTAGIAVVIFTGQWRDFLGLQVPPSGLHFHEKMTAVLHAMPTLHSTTALLGLGTLLVLWMLPRWLQWIPAPLLALAVVTGLQSVFDFEGVATVGSAFGGIPRSLPPFTWPEFSLAQIVTLVGPAFAIAILGAIESLLSAVVADGMAGTRHDPNQELLGQGIANFAAPLFGGFAATGAIARTATNIRHGATSPLAGVVHCMFLVAVLLLLAPLASAIPLCALSAILFFVAWNMADLPKFLRLLRFAPRADAALLLLTFLLTILVDLVVAVNVGVVLASLLFVKRMAETVQVEEESPSAQMECRLPPGVLAYSIAGPFFFGAAEKLERTLGDIQQRAEVLILQLDRVPVIDATGLLALEGLLKACRRHGTRVLLVGLRANVERKLERAGLLALLGAGDCVPDLGAALVRLNLSDSATPENASLR